MPNETIYRMQVYWVTTMTAVVACNLGAINWLVGCNPKKVSESQEACSRGEIADLE